MGISSGLGAELKKNSENRDNPVKNEEARIRMKATRTQKSEPAVSSLLSKERFPIMPDGRRHTKTKQKRKTDDIQRQSQASRRTRTSDHDMERIFLSP
jgi:hypothetical protein